MCNLYIVSNGGLVQQQQFQASGLLYKPVKF